MTLFSYSKALSGPNDALPTSKLVLTRSMVEFLNSGFAHPKPVVALTAPRFALPKSSVELQALQPALPKPGVALLTLKPAPAKLI